MALFDYGYKVVLNAVCGNRYELTDVDRAFLDSAVIEQRRAIDQD